MRSARAKGTVVAVLAWGAALLVPGAASALELDPVGSFDQPVYVTSDPQDPERLFVVEKPGRILLLDHGTPRPFLDIDGRVADDGEEGLLSMALDPGYETNGRFYVYYVGSSTGNLHISEFTAAPSGNSAPASSERPILTVPHPGASNHNGGQLQIGPDDLLYIGTGDGGGGGDPDENAQDLGSLLGKMLRIDPDPGPGGAPFTVPPDNPYANRAGVTRLIWSSGLRNPWRFSFDRANGALVIGDVGQGDWEEIDYVRGPAAGRGANFGWDCREGAHPYEGPTGCPPLASLVDPVFEYGHTGGRCSITGGYVIRDPGLPGNAGRYLYADACAGPVRSLNPGTGAALGAGGDRSEGLDVSFPSSFGEDSCGRLYVTSLGTGDVFRIEGATPTDCSAGPPPPPPPEPYPEDGGPCAPSTRLGDDVANKLNGTNEPDRLTGLGGDDILNGFGKADCLSGGTGNDRLAGSGGSDRLVPGSGRDVAFGGSGNDRVRARDGRRDTVDCGPGRRDRVKADRKDRVAGSCERVRRSRR